MKDGQANKCKARAVGVSYPEVFDVFCRTWLHIAQLSENDVGHPPLQELAPLSVWTQGG
jgi:hypothetical protein